MATEELAQARPEPGASLAGSAQGQLRTLALIRWVAIAGQTGALLVVHFGFGFTLPIIPALFAVGASVLANILFMTRERGVQAGARSITAYLAFDIVQLAVLLFLTGGLQNPFAFLLLAPIVVSATILSAKNIIILGGVVIAAISVLALWHMPLPWDGVFPPLPAIYVLGAWAALAIGVLFFAIYTWRVAEEARRLSAALGVTQMALAREQQLSALGTLAAAAAHELGSPLGTIAVAAGEISRDLPKDSPLAEDVSLLLSETARCRDILAALAHQPAGDDVAFSRVPISAVAEQAARVHLTDSTNIDFVTGNGNAGTEPQIRSAPEIIHGLGNLVQNAIQFATGTVSVTTGWTESEVRIDIADDGPGFSQTVLDRIGEPYISSRRTRAGHMGLGIFIAQTLLERTGARLIFRNRRSGGAIVTAIWPRADIETRAGELG